MPAPKSCLIAFDYFAVAMKPSGDRPTDSAVFLSSAAIKDHSNIHQTMQALKYVLDSDRLGAASNGFDPLPQVLKEVFKQFTLICRVFLLLCSIGCPLSQYQKRGQAEHFEVTCLCLCPLLLCSFTCLELLRLISLIWSSFIASIMDKHCFICRQIKGLY